MSINATANTLVCVLIYSLPLIEHMPCAKISATHMSWLLYCVRSAKQARLLQPIDLSGPGRTYISKDIISYPKVTHFEAGYVLSQRQETLDLPYLTLLCDNLKNRMFLQNFFSWPYFGNLLYCSSYPHHSTIPQQNNFIRDCRIRLLGQKRMFTAETSVFDLEVLFYSP
jgi:hypothetical protein